MTLLAQIYLFIVNWNYWQCLISLPLFMGNLSIVILILSRNLLLLFSQNKYYKMQSLGKLLILWIILVILSKVRLDTMETWSVVDLQLISIFCLVFLFSLNFYYINNPLFSAYYGFLINSSSFFFTSFLLI